MRLASPFAISDVTRLQARSFCNYIINICESDVVWTCLQRTQTYYKCFLSSFCTLDESNIRGFVILDSAESSISASNMVLWRLKIVFFVFFLFCISFHFLRFHPPGQDCHSPHSSGWDTAQPLLQSKHWNSSGLGHKLRGLRFHHFCSTSTQQPSH